MALSLRPELKNFDKAKRERRRKRELTEDQKNEIREAFDLFDADKGERDCSGGEISPRVAVFGF